jgi:hypothetical protein
MCVDQRSCIEGILARYYLNRFSPRAVDLPGRENHPLITVGVVVPEGNELVPRRESDNGR